jgi:hypothetical protein
MLCLNSRANRMKEKGDKCPRKDEPGAGALVTSADARLASAHLNHETGSNHESDF